MARSAILIDTAMGQRAPMTPREWEDARRSLPGPDVEPCCRCGGQAPFGFRYSRDVALWACAEHRAEVEAAWQASRKAPAGKPVAPPQADLFTAARAA
ncbi:hypothetical protein VQ03_28935 [Methylobacterium tarhaniae]|uniref:Uncharacterized protein n=1 Tax=Methylobacterium tarhaniae TaxID=1187852 RepID=A0A0J6S3Y0_9HYPH|nr:hypothetical protein VQ03_28935 [Methylobacterium tarhaniae]